MAADALLRGFTITPGEILGHQELRSCCGKHNHHCME